MEEAAMFSSHFIRVGLKQIHRSHYVVTHIGNIEGILFKPRIIQPWYRPAYIRDLLKRREKVSSSIAISHAYNIVLGDILALSRQDQII